MGKLIRAVLRGGDSGNTVSLTRPLAIVPQAGPARLLLLAEELTPDARTRRRLQRHLERQRRANNPQHYDAQGRIKKRRRGQGRRVWRESHSYQQTRRRLATTERRLAALLWQKCGVACPWALCRRRQVRGCKNSHRPAA